MCDKEKAGAVTSYAGHVLAETQEPDGQNQSNDFSTLWRSAQ
jgi:hypothetical protein